MSIINYYLISRFIPVFLLLTVSLTSFLVMVQLFPVAGIIVSRVSNFYLVIRLIIHMSISLSPLVVPLSCFLTMIFVLRKLCDHSEFIALRSFGFKIKRIIFPFFITSVFLAISMYIFGQNLVPHSKRFSRTIISRLISTEFIREIREGQFFLDVPNMVLFSEKISGDNKNMGEIFIHIKNRSGIENIITAKQGNITRKNTPEGIPLLIMSLTNGTSTKFHSNGKLEKILFENYTFPLNKRSSISSLNLRAGMHTYHGLLQTIEKYQQEVTEANKNGDTSRAQTFQRWINRYHVEFWTRIGLPFQIILFVFLGFLFGVRFARGFRKHSGRNAALVIFGYYILYFIGFSLAKKSLLSPVLSVIIPLVVIGFVGLRVHKKLEWMG